MTGMGEIYDKEITPILTKIYWKVLLPFTNEQAEKAFNRAIASCKWFPKPSELIDLLKEEVKGLSAPEAWYEVMSGLERGHEPNDPIIQKAIRALGGWQRMGLLTYDELSWVEKRFNEHFNTYQNREVDSLIEGEESEIFRLCEPLERPKQDRVQELRDQAQSLKDGK